MGASRGVREKQTNNFCVYDKEEGGESCRKGRKGKLRRRGRPHYILSTFLFEEVSEILRVQKSGDSIKMEK